MSKLQELQTLVAGVSAGGRLLAVLQGGEIIDRAQVAAAVVDVIKEIKGGGAPAPVGPPARLSLGGASAVINQLAFILPRCAPASRRSSVPSHSSSIVTP